MSYNYVSLILNTIIHHVFSIRVKPTTFSYRSIVEYE